MESMENPTVSAHLDVENIEAGYNGESVLKKISFSVPAGQSLAVVGPNGAGKSTLFKVLVGLLPIRSGTVQIHGKPLGYHLDCVAYVPQREAIDWKFPVTVLDVVVMGRFGKLKWLQKPRKEDFEIALHSLEQMGIGDLAKNSIEDLSGGQQQRVFLARALAQNPHILLLDEPFTGVDASTQETTMNLLEKLHQKGVTSMVSTHDLNMAATRFSQVLLINRKIIAYGKPEEVFTPENLQIGFGGQVLSMHGVMVVDECCPPDDLR
ncbi:MAG: metal ABC transporter ATP-binding protein [Chloroflexi bacterium HGW-Chloroflexi-3]|nr:MAG: metal ABC transporter ATP-binding protein [Chloroflexi bacterium HGW-Chloroflexi-3]